MRVLGVMVLLAVFVAACGPPSGSSDRASGSSGDGGVAPQSGVNLVISVPLGVRETYPSTCGVAEFGTAYAALPASRVTVKDQAGGVVGVGNVPTTGLVKDRPGDDPLFQKDCVFSLDLDVSRDAKFYTFSVGPLGDITLSRDELAKAGWVATVGQ